MYMSVLLFHRIPHENFFWFVKKTKIRIEGLPRDEPFCLRLRERERALREREIILGIKQCKVTRTWDARQGGALRLA